MNEHFPGKKLSSFQIIIIGFVIVILIGALLLTLPVSAKSGQWTAFRDALFTAVSAVCVTGLVVKDTAMTWSGFGQGVILILIQIGGLGIVSVAAFIATISGKRISLLERSMLQESISAHQVGGIVRMTGFIFKTAFAAELAGAVLMLPSFCSAYGLSGIWMALFHSVSAFCNAGFDIMGDRTGAYSSLTSFGSNPGIVIPVCLLIITGGIGFLTWNDIALHGIHIKKYRMQSKVILACALVLIVLPALFFGFNEYSAYPLKERICLSLFQAVTPRTAGFNTSDLSSFSGAGRALMIVLMLIGGAPGSTAGGMKTTTIAVLSADAVAVFYRRKNPRLFSRRIEDQTVKSAATLLMMYLFLALSGAMIVSITEKLSFGTCLFETASAIGTVGLSLGITPSLGMISRVVLMILMFLGRVGGMTLMFAAIGSNGVEVSQVPVEIITVG